MSEMQILATIGGVAFIILFVARLPIDKLIGRFLLRIGLWINGISGKEADRIIEFHRTGKLPE